MSTWMAIALAVPLWAIVLLLVLAFFRGAQLVSGDEDGPETHQDGPGSTIAGSPVPTQPPGPPAPPAPDFRRID